MKSRLKKFLATLPYYVLVILPLNVCLIVVLASLGYALLSVFLDLPDVYMSNSTGECVRVVEYGTGAPEVKDCSELPSKYNLVWVE